MKKLKVHSQASMKSSNSFVRADKFAKEVEMPSLDTLTVKILSLRLPIEDFKHYSIKVTFFDQLLVTGTIVPIGDKDDTNKTTQVMGTMNYDPSDYEKMCLFADNPLVVSIQPLNKVDMPYVIGFNSPSMDYMSSPSQHQASFNTPIDISCCNVDILPLFIGEDKLCVKKRMQPMIRPSVLNMKSWDNLPLLTMELEVIRNPANVLFHNVLKSANYMKITLVAAYNMLIPFDAESVYTAATKTALSNESNTSLVIFNQGSRDTKKFIPLKFYPQWESQRLGDEVFTEGDEKYICNVNDIQNFYNIDIEKYIKRPSVFTTVWGSFHRTLMLEKTDTWMFEHLIRYNWPLEVHIYGERGGYSFMTYLDLFKLLYPGEQTLRLAVPLYWVDADIMQAKCNCELLLTPNEKAPSAISGQKRSKDASGSAGTSTKSDAYYSCDRPTGADEGNAFVIVEVKFGRPLQPSIIPHHIPESEVYDMLRELEYGGNKRKCTGRGQLVKNWQITVRAAANSLRKVPQYGTTEFCAFSQQLSETRTRVELFTSFWQEAAIYVNNNFIVDNYLQSDSLFEELLMISHTSLMKTTCDTLVGVDNRHDIHPLLKAARHARHMQDVSHATELYLQLIVTERPNDACLWRELATTLRDHNPDWAAVCIDEALELDPRHGLTLLSKGSMVFERDRNAAEPFFQAILNFYPFWTLGWIIANAYFVEIEHFYMADKIMECIRKTKSDGLAESFGPPRSWERELGDWWDQTPLLPGVNLYYDAADLLLRLRAINLAEICAARALSETSDSAIYCHIVSLCCRLRWQIDDAICHLRQGLELFGEISYLRSLEAECLHKKRECSAAMLSLEKAGTCVGPYSTLLSLPTREPPRARSILVDLLRRHPSAYAWMALADDWMARSLTGEGGDGSVTEEQTAATLCAVACAVQALKWDRRAGRAWALLAVLVKPQARRDYCREMACVVCINFLVSLILIQRFKIML